MKLATKENTMIETNLENESQEFLIGDASVIIQILRSKFYANPIQTLVQEYICNARDAVRESGMKKNIEVQIPTDIDPTFRVRDYGVGLSPDRIKNVFVSYGKSTKRDNNNQTGGFGIGAKSAWSYTELFTVVSYFDGVCRIYNADIGKKANGSFEKVSEEKTSEENGTEVIIGVKPQDVKKFKDAILRCCMFWKGSERPILKGLIKEEIPEWYTKNTELSAWSGTNWRLYDPSVLSGSFITTTDVRGNTVKNNFILIDSIAYPLTGNLMNLPEYNTVLGKIKKNWILLVELNNGDVEIAASREQMSDVESTRTKLSEVFKKIDEELEEMFKEDKKQVKTIEQLKDVFLKYKSLWEKTRPVNFQAKNKKNYTISTESILEFALNDSVVKDEFEHRELANGKVIVTTTNPRHLLVYKNDKSRHFFYRDDANLPAKDMLGMGKLREKVRHFLGGSMKTTVCLLTPRRDMANKIQNEAEFFEFVKEIGALPITKLPDPPAGAKFVKEKVSRKGKITVHQFLVDQYYSSRVKRETKSLDFSDLTLNSKTIVFQLDERETPTILLSKWAMCKFLAKKGYSFYGFSPTATKKIKDEYKGEPGVTLEYVLQNILKLFPVPKEYFESIRYEKWNGLGSLANFDKYKDQIKDKRILSLFEYQKKVLESRPKDSISLPREITDLIESQRTELQAESILMDDMKSKVLSELPLLNHLHHDYYRNAAVMETLVSYLNGKFRAK